MSKQTFFAPKLTKPLSTLEPGDLCRITINDINGEWRISSQLPTACLTIIEQNKEPPITTIVSSDQKVIHVGHIQKQPK